VKLTVTDGSNNTATCNATVTVKDVTPPTANCKNIDLNLSAAGTATIVAADINNGSSDVCGAVTLSASRTSFNCADLGPNTVKLTVTDGSNNTATCNATVTVKDVTPPTANCKNIDLNLSAAGTATIVAADINNGSSDVCGAVTLSASKTSFSCADLGPNTVKLTVTDGSNNTATCNATVTVKDITPPTANCKNIDLNLSAAGTATIVAADINNGSSDVCGAVTLSASKTSFSCADLGPNTVKLTVTDGSNNTATCNATVTVKDVTIPVITVCAPDQNVNLNNYCKVSVPNLVPAVTATDNCTVTVTQSPIAGTLLNSSHNQTHVVTITATDAAGNTATCSTTLTAKDVTVPVISVCAPAQNVNLDAGCKISVPNLVPSVTASDNCTVTVTQTPLAGTLLSSSHNQAHVVTITATDAAGNTATCSAILTAKDVTVPVISVCAPAQNVNLDAGCKISVPNLVPSVTASDNCTVTVTQSPAAGALLSSSHNQAHIVTITATDAAGNTATCSATLTAKDVTIPVITVCAPDQNVNLNNYCKVSVPNLVPSVTATDNCTVTVTQSPIAGTLLNSSHNQTHVVTITATDAAGNTATCSTTLKAKDVTVPVISVCAPAQNVNLDAGCKDECAESCSISNSQ
jgi:endogenous inhibitor of DNA gyrase (YacG/DUF329 family)/predicted amino acid-binding ACT domain protein